MSCFRNAHLSWATRFMLCFCWVGLILFPTWAEGDDGTVAVYDLSSGRRLWERSPREDPVLATALDRKADQRWTALAYSERDWPILGAATADANKPTEIPAWQFVTIDLRAPGSAPVPLPSTNPSARFRVFDPHPFFLGSMLVLPHKDGLTIFEQK